MDSEDRGRGSYTYGCCYQQYQIIQCSSQPRENGLEEKGESRTAEVRDKRYNELLVMLKTLLSKLKIKKKDWYPLL